MSTKWVYLFTEVDEAEKHVNGSWDAVRGLLGGKGANLFEMTRIGCRFRPASPSPPKPATPTWPRARSSPRGCGIRSWPR